MINPSPVLLGVRTAKATLDRLGLLHEHMTNEQSRAARCALEIAHDALSVLSMLSRGRRTDARAVADKLAREAGEFALTLRQ